MVACAGDDGPSTALEVTTSEFQFSPNEWSVPAGEEITIEITNDGSVLHEWVLMRPGVTIEAESDLPETEEELLAEFVYVEDEVDAGAIRGHVDGRHDQVSAIRRFRRQWKGQLTVEVTVGDLKRRSVVGQTDRPDQGQPMVPDTRDPARGHAHDVETGASAGEGRRASGQVVLEPDWSQQNRGRA